MTDVVFKFPLDGPETGDVDIVELPVEGKLLHAGAQGNRVCVWALLNPDVPRTERYELRMVGTGHPLPEGEWTHLSTFLVQGGTYVFHVFYRLVYTEAIREELAVPDYAAAGS